MKYTPRKLVLHAGCGREPLPEEFGDVFEIRFDISHDIETNAMIRGRMSEADQIFRPSHFDDIYCSHAIEHMPLHEALKTLKAFHSILKPGGHLWILTPDIEQVVNDTRARGLDAVLYESPAGPITAADILWGHQGFIENGHEAMTHRYGYTVKSLGERMSDAGFHVVIRKNQFELAALGRKAC